MKLELILNQPVKIIDKGGVVCSDKTCPDYGKVIRCYLKEHYQSCSKFLEGYKNGKIR